jgi:hypothetical protein
MKHDAKATVLFSPSISEARPAIPTAEQRRPYAALVTRPRSPLTVSAATGTRLRVRRTALDARAAPTS